MDKTEGSGHVLAEQSNWDRAATRVPSACRKESVATGTGVFDQDRTSQV